MRSIFSFFLFVFAFTFISGCAMTHRAERVETTELSADVLILQSCYDKTATCKEEYECLLPYIEGGSFTDPSLALARVEEMKAQNCLLEESKKVVEEDPEPALLYSLEIEVCDFCKGGYAIYQVPENTLVTDAIPGGWELFSGSGNAKEPGKYSSFILKQDEKSYHEDLAQKSSVYSLKGYTDGTYKLELLTRLPLCSSQLSDSI